jgi:hypothetical protein
VNAAERAIDRVLQIGVDRAIRHIRAGHDMDARLALQVAMTVAERIEADDHLDRGSRR